MKESYKITLSDGTTNISYNILANNFFMATIKAYILSYRINKQRKGTIK